MPHPQVDAKTFPLSKGIHMPQDFLAILNVFPDYASQRLMRTNGAGLVTSLQKLVINRFGRSIRNLTMNRVHDSNP